MTIANGGRPRRGPAPRRLNPDPVPGILECIHDSFTHHPLHRSTP